MQVWTRVPRHLDRNSCSPVLVWMWSPSSLHCSKVQEGGPLVCPVCPCVLGSGAVPGRHR